jgi:hypothetical protein
MIDLKELKKLSRYIVKKHEPFETDILEQFQISKPEILTGVHCSNCFNLPMKRIHGDWYCPSCITYSKHSHILALNDYALLIKSVVTNQDIKSFLQIESISTTKRLLSSMNLPHIGDKKARKYYLKGCVKQ